jgi:murein DD-endopeptidase MepM/ murein hydrolase activator NlpD
MATYKIKSGDTLSAIAKKKKTTVAELVKLNSIKDPNKIRAGTTLKLPAKKDAGTKADKLRERAKKVWGEDSKKRKEDSKKKKDDSKKKKVSRKDAVKEDLKQGKGVRDYGIPPYKMYQDKPVQTRNILDDDPDPQPVMAESVDRSSGKYKGPERFQEVKEKARKKESKRKKPRFRFAGKRGTMLGDLSRKLGLKFDYEGSSGDELAGGGMVGASDMSARRMTSSPAKKKKTPQYYKGGGSIKQGKKYAYGGRVAKYKG